MTKCNTPRTMRVDICKSCDRSTKETGKGIETYQPKKSKQGVWLCDMWVFFPIKEDSV